MTQNKLERWFFLALLAGVFILTFFVFQPLIKPVFLALVFAVIFYPVHVKIRKSIRTEVGAALLSVLLVLIFILTPIIIFGYLLFQESLDLYRDTFQNGGAGTFAEMFEASVQQIQLFIERTIPGLPTGIAERVDIQEIAIQIQEWMVGHFSTIFSSAFAILFGVFLLLISLYYFFKDGKRLQEAWIRISPLSDDRDKRIFDKIQNAINSVIKGHLIIAIIQGFLSGIGFAIFGVPSPIIWGFVAALASLVPNLGTGLVNVPAFIYLLIFEGPLSALGLAIWAVIAVGLVDNLIGPKLIERGISIHPLLILFAVLGGIQLFGPLGFVIGPVIIALLFALVELYPVILFDKKEEVNVSSEKKAE